MRRKRTFLTIEAVLVVGGVLAWLFGLHHAGLGLLVVALALGVAWLMLVLRPALIAPNSLLHLHLDGALHEFTPASPLEMLRGRGAQSLFRLRQALNGAAQDPALAAVLVELGQLQCGLASAQELHDLLYRVRQSGKRVICVLSGDTAMPREYLVALAANELILNPDTALAMVGFAAGGIFAKQALDKLEVQAQVLQWKEYKGAAEMFSREHMSAPLRESLEAIIGDWETVLSEALARSRAVAPERARELINSGFLSAKRACAAGLADKAGHAEDVIIEFAPPHKSRRVVSLGRSVAEYIGARTAVGGARG